MKTARCCQNGWCVIIWFREDKFNLHNIYHVSCYSSFFAKLHIIGPPRARPHFWLLLILNVYACHMSFCLQLLKLHIQISSNSKLDKCVVCKRQYNFTENNIDPLLSSKRVKIHIQMFITHEIYTLDYYYLKKFKIVLQTMGKCV